MTDARMPERYLMDRRLVRLTDEEFRAFVTAMMWSVANRTEGVIEHDDLALIPHFRSMTASALVAAGLWDLHEHGYLILDFEATQTTKAQLEAIDHKRAMDRDRQARHRVKKGRDEASVTEDVTRDVTGNDKGKDRQGQDRQGKASKPNHLHTSGPIDVSEQRNEMQRTAIASWEDVA